MSVGFTSRLSYANHVGRAILRDPFEAKERILERIDDWKEQRTPQPLPVVDQSWEQRLHELLNARWPCEQAETFSRLWSDIERALEAEGLAVGRGAFGGWDDADPALARAAWCITKHARPRTVLETGVGRGVTTRVILEALGSNADGRLLSIDQPPLLDLDLHAEIAAAVPENLRSRWTLVRGSSRRRLSGLLRQIEHVDFFLHDSMHTARNMKFELHRVWPTLRPGGFVLMDDVEKNDAFSSFVDEIGGEHQSLVAPADDRRALIGLIQKAPS